MGTDPRNPTGVDSDARGGSAPGEDAPTDAPVGFRLGAVADERFLTLVHARFRPEIVRRYALPTYAGELPYHLDPVDWRAGYLSVVEGGPPSDVRDAMQERTPQAQLRDLFRPVFSLAPVPLDLHPLGLDPGGRSAWGELRAALEREPVPTVARSIEVLAEARAEWRRFVDAPWQPFLRDDEPRRAVMVAIEPSLSA